MQESEYQEALKKQAPAIRKLIMDILQLVDQSAYSAIAKNDPTGIKHIRFDNTEFFSTDLNPIDGLPVFIMDPYFFTILPLKQKMFAIAHELAHYMMDDFEELYKKSIKQKKILIFLLMPLEEYRRMKLID